MHGRECERDTSFNFCLKKYVIKFLSFMKGLRGRASE
jgi:hypothetical protein